MTTYYASTTRETVADTTLSTEEKIRKLLGIESEARDLQRAASQSLMNDADGWNADLREVRLALHKLGRKSR